MNTYLLLLLRCIKRTTTTSAQDQSLSAVVGGVGGTDQNATLCLLISLEQFRQIIYVIKLRRSTSVGKLADAGRLLLYTLLMYFSLSIL